MRRIGGMVRGRAGSARHAALVLLGLLLLAVTAQAKPQKGIALGGNPKYGANFTHFDYANPDAPKGGELRMFGFGSFDTLNPFTLKGREAPGLDGLVFESLMTSSSDEPFSMYPLLASTIDHQPGPKGGTIVFALDPAARFSDGKPVTADDVVFSLTTLRSDGARPLYRYYYQAISKIEAVNARTVRMTYTGTNREIALIAGQFPILPKHIYGKGDFASDFTDKATGSGPYVVETVDAGKSIRYARDKNYWGRDLPVNRGRYNFDHIRYTMYRDLVVTLEGFKAGEFDFYPVNYSKQWAVDIKGDKWDKGYIAKELLPHSNVAGIQGYVFNQRREIFKDRRVRKALALAMDFDWSNRNLFYGQYTELDSYFDNSELAAEGLPSPAELKLLDPLRAKLPEEVFTVPMGPKAPKETNIRNRLRQAKKMLNDAGWRVKDGVLTEEKTGRRMEFTVTLVSPAFERITEPFLGNLSRLGVKGAMKVVDSSVYERIYRTFDFDMVVTSVGQSLSPGNEQREFWHSDSAVKEGSRNVFGVQSPAIDALVEHVIAADDRPALVTAIRALDRALWHEHLVVPHWYSGQHRVTYWNKFGQPAKAPLYYQPTGWAMFWWHDAARDKALQAAMQSGKAHKP